MFTDYNLGPFQITYYYFNNMHSQWLGLNESYLNAICSWSLCATSNLKVYDLLTYTYHHNYEPLSSNLIFLLSIWSFSIPKLISLEGTMDMWIIYHKHHDHNYLLIYISNQGNPWYKMSPCILFTISIIFYHVLHFIYYVPFIIYF